MIEGCHRLTSVVPLREDEEHCHYCSGYGGHPPNKQNPRQQETVERCYECGEKGKHKIAKRY